MKTFENFKAETLATQERIKNNFASKLNTEGLTDNYARAWTMGFKEYENNIKNIDELAVIKLGSTTNGLISAIRRNYKNHFSEYWDTFENFINNYIIGKTQDGQIIPGSDASAVDACRELGITLEDLMCFKGHDPLSDEMCDAFRQYININFGSNIPLSSVERKAEENYFSLPYNADEAEKDKAYLHFKEIQRDSGQLCKYGNYYFLADNKCYQDAKARCAERNNQMWYED